MSALQEKGRFILVNYKKDCNILTGLGVTTCGNWSKMTASKGKEISELCLFEESPSIALSIDERHISQGASELIYHSPQHSKQQH